eukprot:448098-Prorocentrum_minimum.AAC.1
MTRPAVAETPLAHPRLAPMCTYDRNLGPFAPCDSVACTRHCTWIWSAGPKAPPGGQPPYVRLRAPSDAGAANHLPGGAVTVTRRSTVARCSTVRCADHCLVMTASSPSGNGKYGAAK